MCYIGGAMVQAWGECTWEEIRSHDRGRLVAILPIGAVEAHGPHLPLLTDLYIAEGMAKEGAAQLEKAGRIALVLPALTYSAAPFGAGFPGTVSLGAGTVRAILTDLARSLAAQGIGTLVIATAHLDPEHLRSLHEAVEQIGREKILTVIFPDLTRKPWALRMTEEFKSGACHAGRYEGSVVMAVRPDLVREEIRRGLPPNPRSLSTAIREGAKTFEQAGGPRAYFGEPAAATKEEGAEILRVLGKILCDAVLEGGGTCH